MGRKNSFVVPTAFRDLEFYDDSQRKFFDGYGESIESKKENENGKDQHSSEVVQPMATPAPEPNNDLVNALQSLAAGQQAILEQLEKLNKPTRKTTRRKTTAKRATKKAAAKKSEPEKIEGTVTTEVPEEAVMAEA